MFWDEDAVNLKHLKPSFLSILEFPGGHREIRSCRLCCTHLDESIAKDKHYSLNLLHTTEPVDPCILEDGIPLVSCPFCGTSPFDSYEIEMINDIEKLGSLLTINTCDFCEDPYEDRVVNKLHDKDGFHILNKCKFGCDNPLSDPAWLRGNLQFRAIDIRLIERTYEDSRWRILVEDNLGRRVDRSVTRRTNETKESLAGSIHSCSAHHELDQLHLKIYYD